MSLPTSFNPSDYEYLLKSLADGNMIAKSQSLKRFNILVVNDKKQFSVYAKRIVLALQDMMQQQKQQINLLAAMLVLEVINLNPKDIQYYIRTKLLKQVVVNLGDPKPQVRKTCHYCLLAFVKTFKHLDQVINLYIDNGINSAEPQLRQKCLNSFQSIVITETKYLNWSSAQFKRLFQLLLQKLKDQNPYVQKAAEQCLLTLSRLQEVKIFIKKLNPTFYSIYKLFYESQKQLGNLTEIKIQPTQKMGHSQKSLLNLNPPEAHKISQKNHSSHTNINEKLGIHRQDSVNKQAIIERIEQIRRNAQTPRIQDQSFNKVLTKKSESLLHLKESLLHSPERQRERILPPFVSKQEKIQAQKQIKQKIMQPPTRLIQSILSIPAVASPPKIQKVQNVFGRKVLEDLKNQKDWKIRLQAIEELQSKFQQYKQSFEIDSLMKIFVPILIRLLADQNFKIAFISLKIIEQILKIPKIKLEVIVPQVLQKLNDNKIALRQNVSKLIRVQYLNSNNRIWIDCLIDQLKKNNFPGFREQVLNILSKLYEDRVLDYSYEKIIEEICPLMDDSKTKIKIRTLDLLVLITIKTQKIDSIKSILMNKLNQVYYQMYIQKVAKQTKNIRATPSESQTRLKQSKSIALPSLKKAKTSAKNTTSSSLQKYSKTIDAIPLNRAVSFIDKNNMSLEKQKRTESIIRNPKIESIQLLSVRNIRNQQQNLSDIQRNNFTPPQSVRKRPLNYKKKLQRTLESKLTTNYTTDTQGLRPLSDPQKQLRNALVDIKSDDWQTSNDSLIKLRRIIIYHSQLLNIVIIKSISTDIMKHVESLRSSLSKNAVITINQLSNAMKKSLDSQLQLIFNKLMKKTLDTNSFISQQVKKALISISSNSNQNKVVTLLYNFHTSRSLPIKQNIIYILQVILYIPKVYDKELERIVQILIDFMGEGAIEIREKTKILMNYILGKEKSNSKIYKIIPNQILDKLKRRDSTVEKNESIFSVSPTKQKQPEQIIQAPIPIARKKKKIIVFPEQFGELQELAKKCEVGQWKVRLDNLVKIFQIAKTFPQEISQHKMGVKFIDLLSKQINDPNSKVSTNALLLFKEIAPKIPRLIQSNLSIVANEIFNCFASQKNDIRQSALQLFDLIVDIIEKWLLIQHLCNGALYGPVRSKASILVKLLKILPDSFKERKSTIARHVYGMINKVAEEGKNEIMPILKELVIICLNLGGDDALSALKQQAKSLAE